MHAGQPRDLELIRYSSNALELFWQQPETSNNPSYQIYRNGSFLTNTAGQSFFDESALNSENLHYLAVVVNNANSVSGVAFITATAEDLFQCSQVENQSYALLVGHSQPAIVVRRLAEEWTINLLTVTYLIVQQR